MGQDNSPLCACAMAWAFGILWGVTVLAMSWLSMWCGYATAFVHLLSSIYLGYTATYLGGIWGLLYGFADGFISAWIVVMLYNACCKCKCKS